MGILQGIGQLAASNKNQLHRPFESNLWAYEGKERGEIDRLNKPDPYGGNTLGLSRNAMLGLTAEGRDLTRGERVGNRQRIADSFSRAGSFGKHSAQAGRATERADLSALTRMALVNRRNIIQDQMVRRNDYSRRLRAIQGAYRFGVGAFNQAQSARAAATSKAYGSIGGAFDDAAAGGLYGKGTKSV